MRAGDREGAGPDWGARIKSWGTQLGVRRAGKGWSARGRHGGVQEAGSREQGRGLE